MLFWRVLASILFVCLEPMLQACDLVIVTEYRQHYKSVRVVAGKEFSPNVTDVAVCECMHQTVLTHFLKISPISSMCISIGK